jgi:hypothetical protein
MSQAISEVEHVARENCRITVDEVAAMLGIIHGSTHHIIYNMLLFHKLSAKWVPSQATLELKDRCMDIC